MALIPLHIKRTDELRLLNTEWISEVRKIDADDSSGGCKVYTGMEGEMGAVYEVEETLEQIMLLSVGTLGRR